MDVSRKNYVRRRKTFRDQPLMTLTRICVCCGKKILYLRRVNPEPGQWKYVCCYDTDWDGNPWYVPGAHVRHLRSEKYLEQLRKRLRKSEDSFFVLDE